MSNALKPYHPVKTAVAILLMLLFLTCIGLLVSASNKGATINGPVHIAANSARVCVTLNDEILVLDTRGALQERHALEAMGIATYPIDLRLKHDGTLMVATQRPAGLHICDSMSWQCRAVESLVFRQLRGQIKVQPDAGGKGLFVSDTAGGGLHWLSADGQTTRALSTAKGFQRINDIALDDKQRLWLADSGNRKPVYAEGEIETHIASLLSRATRLGIFAMLRYQFRHREPTTIASAFYIVTIAAVFWCVGLWRFMFPGK